MESRKRRSAYRHSASQFGEFRGGARRNRRLLFENLEELSVERSERVRHDSEED